MSKRIGWRLRRKNRLAPKYDPTVERVVEKKKRENRFSEAKRKAAEKYIQYLSNLR